MSFVFLFLCRLQRWMKSSPRWVRALLEIAQWIQGLVFITLKEKTTEKNRRYLFQDGVLLKPCVSCETLWVWFIHSVGVSLCEWCLVCKLICWVACLLILGSYHYPEYPSVLYTWRQPWTLLSPAFMSLMLALHMWATILVLECF